MTDTTTTTETEVDEQTEVEQTETPATEVEQTDEQTEGSDETEGTYPAHIVKKLRSEAAAYRQRAHDAEARLDEAQRQLHTAKVAQTGRLEVADDLDFDPEHLTSDEKLAKALDELLARRPHLASRRLTGNVSQGYAGGSGGGIDFASLLRRGAGG